MAAKRGLKTVAVLNEDTLFPKAIAQGTVELAKKRGLQVVLVEAYPKGTTDFRGARAQGRERRTRTLWRRRPTSTTPSRSRARMKELDVNPKMVGVTVGGDLPKFHEVLGRDAEFVYGGTQWLPELVTLRARRLDPDRAPVPGRARSSSRPTVRNSPVPTSPTTRRQATAACQILLEAIKRAGSLDGDEDAGRHPEAGQPHGLRWLQGRRRTASRSRTRW